MNIEKISNLIKMKRKEKGMTQEELAIKLNVTEKAISRWETGRGTPDISLLIPLSKELELDVSELLSGKENEKNLSNNIEKVIEYEKTSKKIKNKLPLIISILLYSIFLLLYLLYLKISYKDSSYTFNYTFHIIFSSFLSLLIIISNWNLYTNYYDNLEDKKRIKKITYIIMFIIYIIMVLNITIFDRPMFVFNLEKFKMGFKYGGFNIIPFKTILDYIFNFNRYPLKILLVNIVGNILIFMPVQYLIMKIFYRVSFKKYLLIDFIMLVIIEFIQLITSCGVFDIDDIILNIFGMYIVYYIYTKKLHSKK